MTVNLLPNNRANESTRNFQDSSAALDLSLSKLEAVLNDENAIIESHQSADHDSFALKKNHILRELMILQRSDKNGAIVNSRADKLIDIRKLIDSNKRLLSAQIEAMSEITNLLTQAAIAEGEDGTYTRKM